MSKTPFLVDDVGEQLETAVTDHADRYENALITTYTVSPSRLEWFSDFETTVCAPGFSLAKIRQHDAIDDGEYTLHEEDIHGKCVVLWGETAITCWVGSFNLTAAGLSDNLEWAGRLEGTVTEPFDHAAIRENDLPPSPTNNTLIDQVLDVVQSIIGGTYPRHAEDHFQRDVSEPAFVHSATSNTLRRSIARILRDARGSVEFTYFTPAINKTGVENVAELVPNQIPASDIRFNVYGARPEAAIDPAEPTIGTFVTSDHVADLQRRFDAFTLWTRISGDAGNTLPTGSQIRRGLAHLKVLLISYTDATGQDQEAVLLTSANFTQNAWKRDGGNIEFGIWLRDATDCETVRSFFLDSLADCYARADEQTLEDIDERLASGNDFEAYAQVSLAALLADTLKADETGIALQRPWVDLSMTVTDCTWVLRDVVTGEVNREAGAVDTTADGWHISLPAGNRPSNTRFVSLELTVETPLESPVYELSDAQQEKVAAGTFALSDWDQIIIDEVAYPTSESIPAPALRSADAVWVCREYETPLSQPVRISPAALEAADISDPFLPEPFLTDVDTQLIHLDRGISLPAVRLTFPDGLRPPIDAIRFSDEDGEHVHPIGRTAADTDRLYAFSPDRSGTPLTITADQPFRDLYPDTVDSCTLPRIDADSNSAEALLHTLDSIETTYSLAELTIPDLPARDQDIGRFIHEDTAIDVALESVPEEFANADHAYSYHRSGYFYHAPTQRSCGESFTPPAPYSEVKIEGLVGLATSAGRCWFRASETGFTTRKRLVDEIDYDLDVPSAAAISEGDDLAPIGWLGFDLATIALEDVGEDILEDLNVEFWRDSTHLPISDPIHALRTGPPYYALPLLPSLAGSPVTFHVVLKPPGDETSSYAWAVDDYPVSLTQTDPRTYTLKIGAKVQIPITDDPKKAGQMLSLDRLHRTNFGIKARHLSCLPTLGRKPDSLMLLADTVLHFEGTND